MKKRILRASLLSALFLLLIITNTPYMNKNETKVFSLPGLPRPIAKTPVAITSAGQNTDTYIIHDISNQLMIRSYFMPQAKDADLKDVKTIVFVVGYSSLGLKLQNLSYEEEKARIEKILQKTENDKDIRVITIVLGEEHTKDKRTEELLELIGTHADYLIGLKKSTGVDILTELAKNGDIPLTLVRGVTDISEPFASAFR